jgi:hypothetical protein
MRILLKFPTRGRPQQFLKTLHGWLSQAADPSRIVVLVSYDDDDATMTPEIIAKAEAMHPALVAVGGHSKSKIDACNRDLWAYGGEWNVVLLISDDMWCVRQGWDKMIRENMTRYFPDTDGALWFYDGAQRRINTLECVGKARYAKHGVLYHPDYFSFWCDNETTAVGLRDKKLVMIEQSIAHHQHPSWLGGMKKDATYQRNHGYWAKDQATYERRKAAGFPA